MVPAVFMKMKIMLYLTSSLGSNTSPGNKVDRLFYLHGVEEEYQKELTLKMQKLE